MPRQLPLLFGVVTIALLAGSGCIGQMPVTPATLAPAALPSLTTFQYETIVPVTQPNTRSTPARPVTTVTPTVPTVAPSPELSNRHPSIQAVIEYVSKKTDIIPAISPAYETQELDVDQDGRPDQVLFDPAYATVAFGVVYRDVNGDKDADLVAYGYDGLFVLGWHEDHYELAYHLLSNWGTMAAKYGSSMTMSFSDLTLDGSPEIVYDETSTTGGTGILLTSTERYVVYCSGDECNLAWQSVIKSTADDYNMGFGGIARRQSDITVGNTPAGAGELRVLTSGFRIDCCSASEPDPQGPSTSSLVVERSLVATYQWNGQVFEKASEQIVSIEHEVKVESAKSATSSTGVAAELEPIQRETLDDVRCRLQIAGDAVGGYFGCRTNFTVVAWRDLNGDGREEATVTAYSPAHPMGPDAPLSDVACAHQHFLAYQWDGNTGSLIADVAGCVVDPDLFGVRLADIDGDGVIEIVAAPLSRSGALPDRLRAYKWNGSRFVMWSELPEPRP